MMSYASSPSRHIRKSPAATVGGVCAALFGGAILFLAATNPGPQQYQAWLNTVLTQELAQSVVDNGIQGSQELATGVVTLKAGALKWTKRENKILWSVYTTEMPGVQGRIRAYGYLGTFRSVEDQ